MLSAGLTLQSSTAAHQAAGLIGPNAVIQLVEALGPYPDTRERVFASVGMTRFLTAPPDAMIDETIPARLFTALWREAPPGLAEKVAHQAGRLTGAYILANRIPRAARLGLTWLPRRLSAGLLLNAVQKHAWTFAGTGICRVRPGQPALVSIMNNPLTMPGGVWHVGVFEALFRSLIHPATRVSHCAAKEQGHTVCQFRIDLAPQSAKDAIR
jgi:divinyl protochlorophyllide a 8-vinyl-reductase